MNSHHCVHPWVHRSWIVLTLAITSCGISKGSESKSASVASTSPSALEQLGEAIFNDTRLSSPEGVSCASCHSPALAFTGSNGSPYPAVARGSLPGRFGVRNAPTAQYAGFSPPFEVNPDPETPGAYVVQGGQFWDGRAADLQEQAKGPFLNPNEMNNPSKGAVVSKIASGAYAGLFEEVFGPGSLSDKERAFDQLAFAIATYEQGSALNPFSSKFDAYLRGEETLTAAEAKGFELFKDPEKGNCLACHAGDPPSRKPEDWLFTDFTYDNLGVPRNPQIPANQQSEFFDLGLCQQPGLAERLPTGLARESLCGAFKVPTLRNVALTAPYMHNGFFTNLRDVVSFYVTRETHPHQWYPRDLGGQVRKYDDLPLEYHGNVNRDEAPYDRGLGETPRLEGEEIDAVVAFLKTLTDRRSR